MTNSIWAIAGVNGDGVSAEVNRQVATLVRGIAAAGGLDPVGVVATGMRSVATDLLAYLPRIVMVEQPIPETMDPTLPLASRVLELARQDDPSYIFVAASPDGRDIAAFLSATLGWGVLGNAIDVRWESGRPIVDSSALAGKFVATSEFVTGRGIITVRPNAVQSQSSETVGVLETRNVLERPDEPIVKLVSSALQTAVPPPALESAPIIVAGGRGIGGAEGFELVRELADAVGGAVGATRPPVDEGWIPYDHQIGQTGKIVKPQLYIALGISGAIQHRVGMQTAGTIVAIDRDPEAPIGHWADLFVIGDLFDVVPEMITLLRRRAGSSIGDRSSAAEGQLADRPAATIGTVDHV